MTLLREDRNSREAASDTKRLCVIIERHENGRQRHKYGEAPGVLDRWLVMAEVR